MNLHRLRLADRLGRDRKPGGPTAWAQRIQFGGPARIVAALMLVLGVLAGTQQPVGAVPGDTSNAEGQFLSGTLLGGDLDNVAAIGGVTATSDGTATETETDHLDLTALGIINLEIPGGVQVPLDLTDVGVLGQYATARDDGSSLGSSGLTQSDGTIGTGGSPDPGVAPGPLSLSLSGLVSDLGLNPALLAEVAQLNLELGIVSAQASQAAPDPAVGDYSIDGLELDFQSATLAALVSDINAAVGVTQTQLNGLESTLNGALSTLLGPLGLLGVNIGVNVAIPDLSAAILGLTSGTISDPAHPGVTVDLNSGLVSVDLDALTSLNGLLPNTDILTDATINTITTNLTGLLQSHLNQIETTLLDTIDAAAVTGGASASIPLVGTVNIIGLNTTVGALRVADVSGISVAAIPLVTLPGASTIAMALAVPISAVTATLDSLVTDLLAPVLSNVVPALKPVLDEVVGITVNNQSESGGVFTETALRVTVLPSADALTLDLATARVGPNALAPTPVISSLTPTSGPTAGGTEVTITGSGFLGTTEVTFDGIPGTALNVVSDTEVKVTSPPHAAGPVDVILTASGGSSAPGEFTYTDDGGVAPSVTGIDPDTGPVAGGQTVTITGDGFVQGVTEVVTDGTVIPAGDVTVIDGQTLTYVTPARAEGGVFVYVRHGADRSTSLRYTYVDAGDAPTVISMIPDEGPVAGGQMVTITGTDFVSGDTAVNIDGTVIPAGQVSVLSPTTLTFITPPHAVGTVDVFVTTPAGDSSSLDYTYVEDAPAGLSIISLDPDEGPVAGGQTVTIKGTGFISTDTEVVIFGEGAIDDDDVTVIDDETIEYITPPHVVGVVQVYVATPDTTTTTLDYTYIDDAGDAPVVDSIDPDEGPTTGGTVVTITGTGLTGTTEVTFDGTPGTDIEVISDTEIKVTTPPGAEGPADVVVTTPGGDSTPGEFTYIAPPTPTITDLDPDSGPTAGGTVVTITGTGLTGTTEVTFDGTPGTDIEVISDTEIKVTTPPGAEGPADVVVTTPGGDSTPGEFTYIDDAGDAPVVDSLDPDEGPTTGGTVVTITGTGLTGTTEVTFDGTPGTDLVVVSDTEITVTTPPGAEGSADVVVTAPGGDSAPGEFTYIAPTPQPPVIDTVTPPTGPTTGGTVVTIIGGGFTGTTEVTFGGVPGTNIEVVSDTEITVTTPPHAVGTVEVIVTTPAGSSNAGEFEFTEATGPTPVDPTPTDPTPTDPTPVDPTPTDPPPTDPTPTDPTPPTAAPPGTDVPPSKADLAPAPVVDGSAPPASPGGGGAAQVATPPQVGGSSQVPAAAQAPSSGSLARTGLATGGLLLVSLLLGLLGAAVTVSGRRRKHSN